MGDKCILDIEEPTQKNLKVEKYGNRSVWGVGMRQGKEKQIN